MATRTRRCRNLNVVHGIKYTSCTAWLSVSSRRGGIWAITIFAILALNRLNGACRTLHCVWASNSSSHAILWTVFCYWTWQASLLSKLILILAWWTRLRLTHGCRWAHVTDWALSLLGSWGNQNFRHPRTIKTSFARAARRLLCCTCIGTRLAYDSFNTAFRTISSNCARLRGVWNVKRWLCVCSFKTVVIGWAFVILNSFVGRYGELLCNNCPRHSFSRTDKTFWTFMAISRTLKSKGTTISANWTFLRTFCIWSSRVTTCCYFGSNFAVVALWTELPD